MKLDPDNCIVQWGHSHHSLKSMLVAILVVTTSVFFLAGDANGAWIENDKNALAGSASLRDDNKTRHDVRLVNAHAKMSSERPVPANKKQGNQVFPDSVIEQTLPESASRIWAMLLVGFLLVALRVRGTMDRSNRVY